MGGDSGTRARCKFKPGNVVTNARVKQYVMETEGLRTDPVQDQRHYGPYYRKYQYRDIMWWNTG